MAQHLAAGVGSRNYEISMFRNSPGGMFWERLEPDCGSEGWDIGVGLDTLLRDSR